jgi:hypothetical protein
MSKRKAENQGDDEKKSDDKKAKKFELKQCSTCHEEKFKFEFCNRSDTFDGFAYRCKLCVAVDDEIRGVNGLNIYEQWIQIDQKCRCQNCGETDRKKFEFAHFEKKKKNFDIYKLKTRHRLLKKEFKKGRILCCLCHLKETLEQQRKKKKKHKNSDKIARKHMLINKLKLDRGGCAHCGLSIEGLPFAYFEFDHLNPEEKEIGMIAGKGYADKRYIKEQKKCQLLCKPCHNEVTRQQNRQCWGVFNYFIGCQNFNKTAENFSMSIEKCKEIVDDRMYKRDVLEHAYHDNWLQKIDEYVNS